MSKQQKQAAQPKAQAPKAQRAQAQAPQTVNFAAGKLGFLPPLVQSLLGRTQPVEAGLQQLQKPIDWEKALANQPNSHVVDYLEERLKDPLLSPEERTAMELFKKQIAPELTDYQELMDFSGWLIGKGLEPDHVNTPWYRTPLTDLKDVNEYIKILSTMRQRFLAQIAEIQFMGVDDLPTAWIYFKYIVRGKLTEETTLGFMQDWENIRNRSSDRAFMSEEVASQIADFKWSRHNVRPDVLWPQAYFNQVNDVLALEFSIAAGKKTPTDELKAKVAEKEKLLATLKVLDPSQYQRALREANNSAILVGNLKTQKDIETHLKRQQVLKLQGELKANEDLQAALDTRFANLSQTFQAQPQELAAAKEKYDLLSLGAQKNIQDIQAQRDLLLRKLVAGAGTGPVNVEEERKKLEKQLEKEAKLQEQNNLMIQYLTAKPDDMEALGAYQDFLSSTGTPLKDKTFQYFEDMESAKKWADNAGESPESRLQGLERWAENRKKWYKAIGQHPGSEYLSEADQRYYNATKDSLTKDQLIKQLQQQIEEKKLEIQSMPSVTPEDFRNQKDATAELFDLSKKAELARLQKQLAPGILMVGKRNKLADQKLKAETAVLDARYDLQLKKLDTNYAKKLVASNKTDLQRELDSATRLQHYDQIQAYSGKIAYQDLLSDILAVGISSEELTPLKNAPTNVQLYTREELEKYIREKLRPDTNAKLSPEIYQRAWTKFFDANIQARTNRKLDDIKQNQADLARNIGTLNQNGAFDMAKTNEEESLAWETWSELLQKVPPEIQQRLLKIQPPLAELRDPNSAFWTGGVKGKPGFPVELGALFVETKDAFKAKHAELVTKYDTQNASLKLRKLQADSLLITDPAQKFQNFKEQAEQDYLVKVYSNPAEKEILKKEKDAKIRKDLLKTYLDRLKFLSDQAAEKSINNSFSFDDRFSELRAKHLYLSMRDEIAQNPDMELDANMKNVGDLDGWLNGLNTQELREKASRTASYRYNGKTQYVNDVKAFLDGEFNPAQRVRIQEIENFIKAEDFVGARKTLEEWRTVENMKAEHLDYKSSPEDSLVKPDLDSIRTTYDKFFLDIDKRERDAEIKLLKDKGEYATDEDIRRYWALQAQREKPEVRPPKPVPEGVQPLEGEEPGGPAVVPEEEVEPMQGWVEQDYQTYADHQIQLRDLRLKQKQRQKEYDQALLDQQKDKADGKILDLDRQKLIAEFDATQDAIKTIGDDFRAKDWDDKLSTLELKRQDRIQKAVRDVAVHNTGVDTAAWTLRTDEAVNTVKRSFNEKAVPTQQTLDNAMYTRMISKIGPLLGRVPPELAAQYADPEGGQHVFYETLDSTHWDTVAQRNAALEKLESEVDGMEQGMLSAETSAVRTKYLQDMRHAIQEVRDDWAKMQNAYNANQANRQADEFFAAFNQKIEAIDDVDKMEANIFEANKELRLGIGLKTQEAKDQWAAKEREYNYAKLKRKMEKTNLQIEKVRHSKALVEYKHANGFINDDTKAAQMTELNKQDKNLQLDLAGMVETDAAKQMQDRILHYGSQLEAQKNLLSKKMLAKEDSEEIKTGIGLYYADLENYVQQGKSIQYIEEKEAALNNWVAHQEAKWKAAEDAQKAVKGLNSLLSNPHPDNEFTSLVNQLATQMDTMSALKEGLNPDQVEKARKQQDSLRLFLEQKNALLNNVKAYNDTKYSAEDLKTQVADLSRLQQQVDLFEKSFRGIGDPTAPLQDSMAFQQAARSMWAYRTAQALSHPVEALVQDSIERDLTLRYPTYPPEKIIAIRDREMMKKELQLAKSQAQKAPTAEAVEGIFDQLWRHLQSNRPFFQHDRDAQATIVDWGTDAYKEAIVFNIDTSIGYLQSQINSGVATTNAQKEEIEDAIAKLEDQKSPEALNARLARISERGVKRPKGVPLTREEYEDQVLEQIGKEFDALRLGSAGDPRNVDYAQTIIDLQLLQNNLQGVQEKSGMQNTMELTQEERDAPMAMKDLHLAAIHSDEAKDLYDQISSTIKSYTEEYKTILAQQNQPLVSQAQLRAAKEREKEKKKGKGKGKAPPETTPTTPSPQPQPSGSGLQPDLEELYSQPYTPPETPQQAMSRVAGDLERMDLGGGGGSTGNVTNSNNTVNVNVVAVPSVTLLGAGGVSAVKSEVPSTSDVTTPEEASGTTSTKTETPKTKKKRAGGPDEPATTTL